MKKIDDFLLKKSTPVIRYIRYSDSQQNDYVCAIFCNVFNVKDFNSYLKNNLVKYSAFDNTEYDDEIYCSKNNEILNSDFITFENCKTNKERLDTLLMLMNNYKYSITRCNENKYYYCLFKVKGKLNGLIIRSVNDDKCELLQEIDYLDSLDEKINNNRIMCLLSLTFCNILVVKDLKEYLDSLNFSTAYNMSIILDNVNLKIKGFLKSFDEYFLPKDEKNNIIVNAFREKLEPTQTLYLNKMQKFKRIQRAFIDFYTGKKMISVHQMTSLIDDVFNSLTELDDIYKNSIVGDGIWHRELLNPFARTKTIFYRGVTAPIYPEMPKIFRNNSVYLKEEADNYREFTLCFPNEVSKNSPLDNLTTMQHYYLPTRLLDITTNPLVALYMSCTNEFSNEKKVDCPGEVISYFPKYHDDESELKYYDSDRVLVLSALSLLEYSEKKDLKDCLMYNSTKNEELINFFADKSKEEFKSSNEDEAKLMNKAKQTFYKLGRIVQKYSPSFDISLFNPFDLLKSYYVKVGYVNERISAQSGSFIIFGLNENYAIRKLESTRNIPNMKRIIIADKQTILSQLASLNISQKTMMPDKEHVAKEITKNCE